MTEHSGLMVGDTLISRLDDRAVVWLCLRGRPSIDRLMKIVSSLGDGYCWGILAAILALTGETGRVLFQQLAVAFVINLSVYKLVKARSGRPRPFVRIPSIHRKAPIPDEFSFPSGHTASAFLVMIVLGTGVPVMFLPFLLFGILIGISRVYLGLHYPTDVLAGALLGSCSGAVSLILVA